MNKPLHCLLATALLLSGATLQLRADEVKMTTSQAVGGHLTLALNADVMATLAWSDGTKQTVESDGSLLDLEVKAPELTITTEDKLTRLYVQGNQLTALDVTKATRLRQLFCADNKIAKLDLAKNTELTTLDAQGNELTTLTLNNAKGLQELNVACNKLTKISLAATARPTSVVANDNQLTALPSATNLTKAQCVWASGNEVSVLPIGYATGLRTTVMSENKLAVANFPFTPMLREVWLDHNELTQLDLSKQSPKLQALVVNDNELNLVKWDKSSKQTAKYVYMHNNALFLNSMPSLIFGGKAIDCNLGGQQPYALPKKVYEVNEAVDINSLVQQNGWGISAMPKVSVVDKAGNVLEAGKDYTVKNNSFVFSDVKVGLHFEVTSASYSDMKWTTAIFNVGSTEGIGQTTAASALQVTTARGTLTLTLGADTRVVVVAADGRMVGNATLAAGSHTMTVPAGVYVVNGQKVMVP